MMSTTVNPDYWALLGIPPGSDSDQLKRAFRREARRWHPDLNLNDSIAEERFKLVNEAYEILSDPIKRESWEASFLYQNSVNTDPFATGFPTFEEYLAVVMGYEYEEVINQDIEYEINEKFDEEVDEEVQEVEEEEWPVPFDSKQSPPIKAFDDIETLVKLTPEEALNGSSVELELQDGTLVSINTPSMAGDGWRLRLAGVAPGGRDHFVQLRVQTEDGLRIDGLRIHYRLELFPADAALGCAVEVPTIDGPVTLQVPPGSSSGRLLRLKGRGLEIDSRRGDQLVEIIIVIPPELGDSERALYSRLQELAFNPE